SLPVSASINFSGFAGYGEAFSGRVGPFDSNSTAFLDAVAASNSTGLFKIPGYDVSKPFPGKPIDGWTIRLAAVDLSEPYKYAGDPSNPLSQYDPNFAIRGQPMIGHSLKIQAPDSLLEPNPADNGKTKIVKTDPSWGMCLWAFGHPNQLSKELYNNPTQKPLAADGSCKGFLSDACIAALEKDAGDSYSIADSAESTRGLFGGLTTCSSLSLYNSTKDLQEYWDSMVVNYWVFVTALVNATLDPEAYVSDWGEALSRVHCVAPNGVGTGKAFTFSGEVKASDGGDNTGGGGGGGGAGGGDQNSTEA
ncbi:hypothetical protein B0J18DRAFT_348954, partial [Chaetomium sp. MPI-SDFR-AT-0129]